jgi:hypothetical protein
MDYGYATVEICAKKHPYKDRILKIFYHILKCLIEYAIFCHTHSVSSERFDLLNI